MRRLKPSVRVAMSLPIRIYVRKSPVGRGKGFITRRILKPLLPPLPSSFLASRPGGTHVSLRYREVLGLSTITFGQFEGAECRLLCELAWPGSTAIDVGANVGVMAIPLARAVGPAGAVIAIEPLAQNARRLRANAALNALTNVVVRQVAAGESEGRVDLQVAEDAAYGSTRSINPGFARIGVVSVESLPLDKIWADVGSPTISVVKIDVEGAEAGVIRGAFGLLQRDRPALMVEASTTSDLQQLTDLLKPYRYSEQPTDGFMPWNHVFTVDKVPG
jgi:FkbM family methyltransferase